MEDGAAKAQQHVEPGEQANEGHAAMAGQGFALLTPLLWKGDVAAGPVGAGPEVGEERIDVGLGGMMTINSNPATLTPYYGGTTHAGFQMFLRFRPSKLKH